MTPLSEAERLARLRLARTDGIGPVAFSHLLDRFGSAIRAVDALPHLTRRGGKTYGPPSISLIEDEVAAGHRLGAELLVLGDPDYPELLAATEPPPPVLWIRGKGHLLSQPCIAIVGARIASAGGQRIARGLAQQLGEAGYVVVSGLARGIDAAAHQGGLAKGTVAVLGGGVDDIYPAENTGLYHQLTEQGCIVSESPVGARAQARDFPRRNRIISGLSRGVVVVEAELRSGSLITARLANEQGRDVFAVPGSPLDPRSRGPNELLRQGAILCEGLEDIERAFSSLFSLRESDRPRLSLGLTAVDGEDMPDLMAQDFLDQVLAQLSAVPTPQDELARTLGQPIGQVRAALLELSLTGQVSLLPSGLATRQT